MRLSLSNGIFAKRTLEDNIAAVSDLGFVNLEFNMKSVEVEDDVSIYRARKLVREHGLQCLTVHSAVLHVRDEVEVHRAVYIGKPLWNLPESSQLQSWLSTLMSRENSKNRKDIG